MGQHRFSRTELLIGAEGIRKLAASQVSIFGIGGVGSFAAEALARSGIGHLHLIDRDVVDITNVNRQIHALTSTIGLPKAQVMAERIKQINPQAQVEFEQVFIQNDNCSDYLPAPGAYVIDALDTVTAKLALITACLERGIPIISSMGAGNKLDPTQFEVTDISKTHTCPLARIIRKELRRRGVIQGVQVVYSPIEPLVPEAWQHHQQQREVDLTRKEQFPPGSTAFVPPVVGMILASVVVRTILETS